MTIQEKITDTGISVEKFSELINEVIRIRTEKLGEDAFAMLIGRISVNFPLMSEEQQKKLLEELQRQ